MSIMQWVEQPAFAASDVPGELAPDYVWHADGRDGGHYMVKLTGSDMPGSRWTVSVHEGNKGSGWSCDTLEEAKQTAENYEAGLT
jgi:hypothetical protein